MTTIDRARTTLDLSNLRLPEMPKIEELRVEEYVDQTGEDALRIQLILNEETQVEDITGESILAIKSTLHDALLEAGIQVFPYISFAKQSELNQLDEDYKGA